MSDPKPNKEQKGLSDKELVRKYEGGKMPIKKIMTAIAKVTPPPKEKDKK